MVKPTITANSLVLEMEGLDKIWSLKSRLEISLEHITDIRVDSKITKSWYHGLRAPGTSIPHVIDAGTFYKDGKKAFWDIHHPDRAVVISLKDETYNELVIEVENPDSFTNQLQKVINLH